MINGEHILSRKNTKKDFSDLRKSLDSVSHDGIRKICEKISIVELEYDGLSENKLRDLWFEICGEILEILISLKQESFQCSYEHAKELVKQKLLLENIKLN